MPHTGALWIIHLQYVDSVAVIQKQSDSELDGLSSSPQQTGFIRSGDEGGMFVLPVQ